MDSVGGKSVTGFDPGDGHGIAETTQVESVERVDCYLDGRGPAPGKVGRGVDIDQVDEVGRRSNAAVDAYAWGVDSAAIGDRERDDKDAVR